MTVILPTRYKMKLSSRTTYPIGAEALSRLLAGVPQFDEISLEFFSSDRLLLNGKTDTLRILEAQYFHRAATIYDGPERREQLKRPRWKLGVFSVLKSDARAIREQIEAPNGAGADVARWFVEWAAADQRCIVDHVVTAVRGRLGFMLSSQTYRRS